MGNQTMMMPFMMNNQNNMSWDGTKWWNGTQSWNGTAWTT